MKTQLDTRTRIIQAAAQIMREKGIAHTTTKEIARAAGCSEGNLYNHFPGKEEIFLNVLREQLPIFIPLVSTLADQVGSNTVSDNLREVLGAALAFYDQAIPMGASFFAERELLARHRRLLQKRGIGPHKANEAVARYLDAERTLGRVDPEVNTAAVADMLLGACFIRSYWRQFLGEAPFPEADKAFLDDLLHTLAL